MVLAVEDGTGKPDALAYMSVADFRMWCATRARDVSTFDDIKVAAALIDGASFIDTNFAFKGNILSNAQAREWPRTGVTDVSGRIYAGVPQRVRDAQAEAAWAVLTEGPLFANSDRGAVKSESVGPISTTYADAGAAGSPPQKFFAAIAALLSPIARAPSSRRPIPFSGSIDTPSFFDVGMMDNPEAGSGLPYVR